ncbi:hypothetical protein [Streptomyces sp. NPDC101115]|uniref:hypothetical protein n=1 Tax=Streptomyces sp. NPDC101115 TaxID=3366106 RepID=UPI003801D554
MTRGSVVRRSWSSFTTGRRAFAPRAGGRGREGYTLWQRVWASFTGIALPPRPEAAPGPVPRPAPAPQPEAARAAAAWFALPSLPETGALTASGNDTVVLEAPSPDGRAVFVLHRTGDRTAEYALELVVRDTTDQPELATVTYTRQDGEEHTLLVPVFPSRFGVAASFVSLNGFRAGSTWQASGPAPVPETPDWPSAAVAHSVRAARNEATREAWRRVGERAGQGVRDVIDGAL